MTMTDQKVMYEYKKFHDIRILQTGRSGADRFLSKSNEELVCRKTSLEQSLSDMFDGVEMSPVAFSLKSIGWHTSHVLAVLVWACDQKLVLFVNDLIFSVTEIQPYDDAMEDFKGCSKQPLLKPNKPYDGYRPLPGLNFCIIDDWVLEYNNDKITKVRPVTDEDREQVAAILTEKGEDD